MKKYKAVATKFQFFSNSQKIFTLFEILKYKFYLCFSQENNSADCKNLKYVFLPQRLFKARKISNFFEGCDNLDPDNVWEVKDLISENSNLISNKKESVIEEKEAYYNGEGLPVLPTVEVNEKGDYFWI